MDTLIDVEIRNFKSFFGSHKVKLQGNLIVITGPNGSGKSNLVEAVAFVTGIHIKELRASALKDFHSINDATNTELCTDKKLHTSVKITLRCKDGYDAFERVIAGSKNYFYINNNLVSTNEYMEILKKYSINSRVNSFFMIQNSIDSFLLKKPLERTAMLEEISGSGVYKVEYNRLKQELTKCQEDCKDLMVMKKNLTKSKKNVRLCEIQAEEYENLCDENKTAKLEFLLFNLYYTGKRIGHFLLEESKSREMMDELEKEMYAKEKHLMQLIDSFDDARNRNLEAEEILKLMQMEMKKMSDELIPIQAKKDYIEKQLSACTKSYDAAKKANESRESSIVELEQALKQTKREKKKFIDQNINKHIELSASQLKEYEKLKNAVLSACASNNHRVGALEREYDILKDRYEIEEVRLKEINLSIEHVKVQKEATAKRLQKWKDSVQKLKNSLRIKQELYEERLSESESSKQQVQALRKELQEIHEVLKDVDHVESTSMKIVQKLKEKNEFPGLYGRLVELCKPIHSRYNVALIKVLKRNADAIVVDTEKTALDCIKYLKTNQIGVCEFLPLDRLQNTTLSEHFRNIKDPPNVKLLYDVVNFQPPEIDRAIFCAVDNVLVCDTVKDALKLAYEMGTRHSCVSLSGIFCNKNGIISGGTLDLEAKARIWDSQKARALREDQQKLTEQLKKIDKNTVSESTLLLLSSEIESIQKALQFSTQDEISVNAEFKKITIEMEKIKNQKKLQEEIFEKASSAKDQVLQTLKKTKSNDEEIKKNIFSDFCKRLGISNIDEYENGNRLYQEKLLAFDEHISRIESHLSFERSHAVEDIHDYEEKIRDLQNSLELLIQQEQQMRVLLEEKSAQFAAAQRVHGDALNFSTNVEMNIMQLKGQLKKLTQDHELLKQNINSIHRAVEENEVKFDGYLTEAKMNGFSIVPNTPESSEPSFLSNSIVFNFKDPDHFQASIDFSKLPERLRNLSSESEIKAMHDSMKKIIVDQQKKIDIISDPDLKASEHLTVIMEKISAIKQQLERNRQTAKDLLVKFEVVKKNRVDTFMNFFDKVANNVNSIYKELMANPAAQAYLIPENVEEPYLGGIRYDYIVPGKRYTTLQSHSGGENVMGALPLLFAMQRVENTHAPFRILDEVDAALDHENAVKLAKFLKKSTESQSIIVSHKRESITEADVIVGTILEGPKDKQQSKVLTFDLRTYENKKRQD